MKAMILAAGLGTRLGVLSEKVPKCLTEVGGVPILERVVSQLKAVGVCEIVINLHHLADRVQQFVESRQSFGVVVHYSSEPELLGTGGGLLKAVDYLREEPLFIVYNADVYSNLDLRGLIKCQQVGKSIATLATRRCRSNRYLVCTNNGEIVGWINEQTGARRVVKAVDLSDLEPVDFCGVHVASGRVFPYFEDENRKRKEFSIFDPYLNAVEQAETLQAYDVSDCCWIDIGTPERLAQARHHAENH